MKLLWLLTQVEHRWQGTDQAPIITKFEYRSTKPVTGNTKHEIRNTKQKMEISNIEARKSKQIRMTKTSNSKRYDLDDHSLKYENRPKVLNIRILNFRFVSDFGIRISDLI